MGEENDCTFGSVEVKSAPLTLVCLLERVRTVLASSMKRISRKVSAVLVTKILLKNNRGAATQFFLNNMDSCHSRTLPL